MSKSLLYSYGLRGLLAFSSHCLATGCVSDERALFKSGEEPCEAFTKELGPSHNCTEAEGGSLDSDLVTRAITLKVLTSGVPLDDYEYGISSMRFLSDGTYQVTKLRFTGYTRQGEGRNATLVQSEAAEGAYTLLANGTIRLESPKSSTCSERSHDGIATIGPHIQFVRREEPFRTSKKNHSAVAFHTNGWLRDFLENGAWTGEAVLREDVTFPPFPEKNQYTTTFRFPGFDADVHYGCLQDGFEHFIAQEGDTFHLVDEMRYRVPQIVKVKSRSP